MVKSEEDLSRERFDQMAYVKRIVCLANSYKIGGSCIAGREVLG